MTAKIQVRRDTTTNWTDGTPPILDVGEIGLDTTLKQIKIGNGSSNWTALPWLAGTFPVYASPSNSDLNDSSNSVQGVYRFADGSALTNAPTSPINITSLDGGVSMLVVKYGTTVVQSLWTDGDGTVTPKSYSRVYDGDVTTWRAWVPQNTWGISATEGVDVVAKSITLKDTGTGLTVDGNSTLTGNVTVNGTTTLGNGNLDIVTVYAGSVTAPIITKNGDLNTGIYFPAADEIAFTAGGVQKFKVTSGTGVLSAQFSGGATFGNLISMSGTKITNVADPTVAQDAVTKNYLDTTWQTSNRIGQIAQLEIAGAQGHSIVNELIGTSFTITPVVFTNPGNTFSTIQCPTGQTWRGSGNFFNQVATSVLVTDSGTTNGDGGSMNISNQKYTLVLIRTS